ncbi:thiolase family protein [Pimelobacter simplex]|uniref:thiolase family protein n=1 Tax=Nocardioides simplex TaxID=2045 RepID=UPI003AAA7C6F
MRDAVIVQAVRTPVGRRNGGLAEVHPVDLSAHVLGALADRAGIDPTVVDDVLWGVVGQVGEQAANVARSAVLAAGWPEQVPGSTIDRQCGSSQQALHFAAAAVISGQADVVVAGGAESMSRVPMGSARRNGPGVPFGPLMAERYGDHEFNQGLAAELLAQRHDLSRTWLDDYSLTSHQRAARAREAGAFDAEIAPLPGVAQDEGIRPDSSAEGLAGLRAAFTTDGVVTAGNSSQISDGAAALLVTTSERAHELGLTPWARVHTAVAVGEDPIAMLAAPAPATARALERAGLTADDIDTFEVNEAFASVVGAWLATTGVSTDRVNPLGGAIALGHPLGGSGARIATTLVHHLHAQGQRYGLQVMCEAGGMANATIFENLRR